MNFTGTPAHFEQIPRFSPYQQGMQKNISNQAYGAGSTGTNFLQQLLDPNSQVYQQFANEGLRQFQQDILPSIASRFASGNALRSSGFQNAALSAGTNLESMLAAQRGQMQSDAASQLMQQLGLAGGLSTTPTFENVYHQRQPGFLDFAGQAAVLGASMYNPALGFGLGLSMPSQGTGSSMPTY